MSGLFDLTGRRALVTGGSSGIGRAIAIALGGAGADVVISHWRDGDSAQAVVAELSALGRRSTMIEADLGTVDAADNVYHHAVDALGGVDILISNVAVERRQDTLEISGDDIEFHVSVNLRAQLQLIQHVLPGMKDRRWGRVLTTGSIQAARPNPRALIYAMLKAAQINMVRNLARQAAPFGVTVNSIAPGAILTERSREAFEDAGFRKMVEGRIPMGRIGAPEDCAGIALTLCSPAGAYITGADIPIDGGWSINDA